MYSRGKKERASFLPLAFYTQGEGGYYIIIDIYRVRSY
jgi:hypothetical protein